MITQVQRSPILTVIGDSSGALHSMQSYLSPLISALCVIASLACVFFLINGGMRYITSAGNPKKILSAKKTLVNAIVGLTLILGATMITNIIEHAYTPTGTTPSAQLPAPQAPNKPTTPSNLSDALIKATTGLLADIVNSISRPFLESLDYFTESTPSMQDNSSVFNMWLVLVGLADALLVLVITLLGFHIMSYSSLGLEELELKHFFSSTDCGISAYEHIYLRN